MTKKAVEDFQLEMVDTFLEAAREDIEEMRRVIKNLRLFEINTPARMVTRGLLLEELTAFQTDLSYVIAGLAKANTHDTVQLMGDQQVKAESDQLVEAFQAGVVIPDSKKEFN